MDEFSPIQLSYFNYSFVIRDENINYNECIFPITKTMFRKSLMHYIKSNIHEFDIKYKRINNSIKNQIEDLKQKYIKKNVKCIKQKKISKSMIKRWLNSKNIRLTNILHPSKDENEIFEIIKSRKFPDLDKQTIIDWDNEAKLQSKLNDLQSKITYLEKDNQFTLNRIKKIKKNTIEIVKIYNQFSKIKCKLDLSKDETEIKYFIIKK